MIDYKNLNKDSILAENIFIDIYAEKDVVQQAMIICTLSDMAKKLGVKTSFERLLKAFKKKRQEYDQASGGGYVEFEYDDDHEYPRLYCGGWMADESGVSIYTDFGKKVACAHPILPAKVLVNVETGFLKEVVAFKTRGKWREIVVDREILCSNNKIVSLSKYGVGVTSENSKALVQYMSDVEAMNERLIPEQKSTSKLGWIGKTFVPYDDSIVFDNEASLSGAYKSVTQHGSYTQWLNVAKESRASRRMEVMLYLAGSFASPLLHIFNALPFIVSVYGKTGKGKTVALMLATSIWADPTEGKYFTRAKATDIALEVRLDFLNHLPMAVDDMTQIQKKVKDDFSDYIYALCSGGGKERSNTSIGLQRQRYWKNTILTNSERSLVSETMNAGAINRIVEMESGQDDYFTSGAKVVDIIKENYGYAGEEFIRIISHMKREELLEIQSSFLDRIYARQTERGEVKEDKQVIPMSIMLTADKIVTEQIFEDGEYLDFDTCYDLLKSKNDIDEDERAYQYILSEVDINRNKFVPDIMGQYKGEVWGFIEDGYVAININAFNRMSERGNFSPKGFLTWAVRQGVLDTPSEQGKYTKQRRVDGIRSRYYFIKLPPETDLKADKDGFVKAPDDEELPF